MCFTFLTFFFGFVFKIFMWDHEHETMLEKKMVLSHMDNLFFKNKIK